MDNSNNSDSSNPLNPTSPFGTSSQPPTDLGSPFSPTPAPPSSTTPPIWPSTPTQSGSNLSQPPTTPDLISSWTPPSNPLSSPTQTFPSTPPFSLPAGQSEPVPPEAETAAPVNPSPTAGPADYGSPMLSPSPLDNPWGAPLQPPPIDEPQSSQPTWVPNTTDTATTTDQTLSNNPPPMESVNPQPIGPEPTAAGGQLEPAPTDLSHLIGNNSQENSGQNPPASSPETLVMPSPTSSVPEMPTIPTEDHKGIPRWLIGVGVGLLTIVVGASAYFILGIGQPPKTTSIPAEVSNQTVKTPPPIATPAPQAIPVATGSANFGELEGNQTPQATSAADLLRQRQQGR